MSSRSTAAGRARAIGSGLAFASAAAVGAHEAVWGRLLGRVIGHGAIGLALTLAVFMAGSGVGALISDRWLRRRPAAQAYVMAEIVVGAGALALLALVTGGPPSAALGLSGAWGSALDLAIATLGGLVPSLGIGATFPCLVAATVVRGETEGRAREIYAAGLAGVVIGVIGGPVLVAPRFGFDRLGQVAAAVNLTIALVAWLALRDGVPDHTEVVRRSKAELGWAIRFGGAGFFGLAAQTVWNRCLVPYAGAVSVTFALIVAGYLLGQCLGFALLTQIPPHRRKGIADLALVAAAPIALITLAALPSHPSGLTADERPIAWLLAHAMTVIAVVAPTSLLLGVTQARVLEEIDRESSSWGSRAARVTGPGSVGAAAGSLLAALWLLPAFGPRVAIAITGCIAACTIVRDARVAWGAGVAATGVLVWMAPGPAWFLGPSFDRGGVLHVTTGIESTTAVIELDLPVEPRIRRVVANGVSYSGDSIFAQRYMRLLAHLPALRARGQQRALVICVGTGTTLDALRAHPFEAIDAVDLDPAIDQTLRWFAHVNHEAASDPRVRLIVADGERFLATESVRYDVITLEPPPPRAPGGSSLYGRELYESARARLAPGGAIAQWLPLHGLSAIEAQAIVRTFLEVFPGATLHLVERNEAILLAGLDEDAPHERARRMRAPVAQDLAGIGLAGVDPLRDTELVASIALAASVAEAPILRAAWPLPELAPFGDADARAAPLDVFLDELAARSSASPTSSAGRLAPAAGAIVRVTERRGRRGDREIVSMAMHAWLRSRPDDPYVQSAMGFGPLLEGRLTRLSLGDREREAVRARMSSARAEVTVIDR